MSLCYFHVWADFLWTASQWAIWEPSFTHTTGFGGKNRGFACCGSWVQAGVEKWMAAALEQNSSCRVQNSRTHAEMMTFCHMSEKHTHTRLPGYCELLWASTVLKSKMKCVFYVNILSHASLLWRHTATKKYFQNIVLLAWTFQPAQQQQFNQLLSDQPTNGGEEIYFKHDNSSNKSMDLGVWLYDKQPMTERESIWESTV